jgi:FkbM family methyltransferase
MNLNSSKIQICADCSLDTMFANTSNLYSVMMFRRIKGKLWASWQTMTGGMLPSFSQAGEDRIIHYFFLRYLGNEKLTYLDIGANHPILFNNTYLFYLRGGKGVCIEPDPKFTSLLKRYRRNDVILQAGIGFSSQTIEADFYVFSGKNAAWNTFSLEEAERRKAESGFKYNVQKQKLLNINDVISKWLGVPPDILSVDAEGIDLNILRSLDFDNYAPKVICVESISFSKGGNSPRQAMSFFMDQKGYRVYADTHINTIYCQKNLIPEGE